MADVKKYQLSIQQNHAKTPESVRYANKNALQVYMDLGFKRE